MREIRIIVGGFSGNETTISKRKTHAYKIWYKEVFHAKEHVKWLRVGTVIVTFIDEDYVRGCNTYMMTPWQ